MKYAIIILIGWILYVGILDYISKKEIQELEKQKLRLEIQIKKNQLYGNP